MEYSLDIVIYLLPVLLSCKKMKVRCQIDEGFVFGNTRTAICIIGYFLLVYLFFGFHAIMAVYIVYRQRVEAIYVLESVVF